jgi:hypothetical protein
VLGERGRRGIDPRLPFLLVAIHGSAGELDARGQRHDVRRALFHLALLVLGAAPFLWTWARWTPARRQAALERGAASFYLGALLLFGGVVLLAAPAAFASSPAETHTNRLEGILLLVAGPLVAALARRVEREIELRRVSGESPPEDALVKLEIGPRRTDGPVD